MTTHEGVVSWFNKDKGFGVIIENETQEEIFIHHSDIISNGNHVILEKMEAVKFNIETRDKKVCACRLTPKEATFLNERPKKKNNHSHNRVRNTTNFNPDHSPPDMRIVYQHGGGKFLRPVSTRDVILVSGLFDEPDLIYKQLTEEISQSGLTPDSLWKSWHGDTHFIADDHLEWKQKCPTFQKVLLKIASFFEMNIKATRLNFYHNTNEWKPFHHDAAAVKKDKAETQNFTVAISFGFEREAAFQHAKTGTILSVPCPSGSIYVFSRDVNIIWKHGIRQMKSKEEQEEGRYSIIAWGWRNMSED